MPATLLKVTLPHRCFSYFFKLNGAKSRKGFIYPMLLNKIVFSGNLKNLLKFNNKDTRMMSLMSFWYLVYFEQISRLFWCFYCWLWTRKCRLGCVLEFYIQGQKKGLGPLKQISTFKKGEEGDNMHSRQEMVLWYEIIGSSICLKKWSR